MEKQREQAKRYQVFLCDKSSTKDSVAEKCEPLPTTRFELSVDLGYICSSLSCFSPGDEELTCEKTAAKYS